jgi:RHS repeat-associated protein
MSIRKLLRFEFELPTGRIITYTYDSAGRPSDAVDTTNSINYAVGSCSNGAASPTTGTCYAPQGAVSQIKNGTNLVSTYLFNVGLQPCWMYATTGTALATNTACTATDPGPGNILDLQYNFNSGHDNGNVYGITNNRDSTRAQTFTYDQVNRIVTAAASTYSQSSAHCWGETYTYDQWANMSAIGAISSAYTGCTQDNLSVSVTTNNQLSSAGFSYDAAGNMTGDNTYTYGYNAESEIKSAAGVNYTYDGDGNRLEKSNGKLYWYGAGTEILDESDLSGNFTNEYVFFGGRRIAIRNVCSGTIDYYEEDMLGSSRTMVQAGQTSVCFDADFLPFGYEKDVTTTCTQNYKFEGKERDTETNNDDFGARYYSSQYGRWLSADWSSVPAPVPYANLTNPQTLNLYAMVSDNPESFADLDGHDSIPSTTGGCVITPGGAQGCKSTANVNVPETTGDGPGAQKTGTGTGQSTTEQAQPQGTKNDNLIVTTSVTTSAPTTALGVLLGEAAEPLGGGAVGGLIGSTFGVGVTSSYVPSTGSLYAGVTANFTPVPGGGTGASVSASIVPPTQNPNSIANGPSFSTTIQPTPVTGVTVTKSPGSGPPVAGPSVGTRVPVSYSASYNFNITRAVNSAIKAVSGWRWF